MQTKYIKIDEVRPHLALQKFALAIQQATREGFSVSNDIKHVARELGFGQFDITLVKTFVSKTAVPAVESEVLCPGVVTPNPDEENPFADVGLPSEIFSPKAVTNGLAIVEGTEIPETELTSTHDENEAPVFVTLGELSPAAAKLESLKTKQELLDFAAEYGIQVPDDLKVVTAVKKFLKEKVTNTP